MTTANLSQRLIAINDCGVIELDIASDLYSIERFGHVDLRQHWSHDRNVQSNTVGPVLIA